MALTGTFDIEELVREIEAYLAAVDLFRAEGLELAWAGENTVPSWWLAEWLGPQAL